MNGMPLGIVLSCWWCLRNLLYVESVFVAKTFLGWVDTGKGRSNRSNTSCLRTMGRWGVIIKYQHYQKKSKFLSSMKRNCQWRIGEECRLHQISHREGQGRRAACVDKVRLVTHSGKVSQDTSYIWIMNDKNAYMKVFCVEIDIYLANVGLVTHTVKVSLDD